MVSSRWHRSALVMLRANREASMIFLYPAPYMVPNKRANHKINTQDQTTSTNKATRPAPPRLLLPKAAKRATGRASRTPLGRKRPTSRCPRKRSRTC